MKRLPAPFQEISRRLLTRLGHRQGLPIREGNAVALLEGDDWLDATEALICGAQRTLEFEMYIWADDAVGRRVLGWLEAAAQRGVRIRGIVDGLGSFGANALLAALTAAGGEGRVFHRVAPWSTLRIWNQRNHRKLLLADGEEAVVGSANWGLDYDPRGNPNAFFDVGIALRGPSVADLAGDFERIWRRCGGASPGGPSQPLGGNPRWSGPWEAPGAVQVVAATSFRGRRALRRHVELLIRQAAEELWIANAYFIPGRSLLRLLARSAQRGVTVRLLLPGRTDQPFVQAAGRFTHGRLLEAGVCLYECPHRVLHAKAAVVDGGWAVVGSANLDPRSFRHNLELNLALNHPVLIERLRHLLEREVAHSHALQGQEWKQRTWLERVWQRLAYACRWWL